MEGMELASQVSCTETYTSGDEAADYRVALLDIGVKKNIVRSIGATKEKIFFFIFFSLSLYLKKTTKPKRCQVCSTSRPRPQN